MSSNTNYSATAPQRQSLGHQARMAATVRGHMAVHRTPRGDIWDRLPEGQFLAVRRGVVVNAPFTLPPKMQAKEDRIERKHERIARARRERGYGKAIAQQAHELAVAAGPVHVDPGLVVEHTPVLRRVITRLSDDVKRGRLPVTHIDKRCIQFAVDHARMKEKHEKAKAIKARSNAEASGRTESRTRSANTSSSTHAAPLPKPQPSETNSPAPSTPSLLDNIFEFFVGRRKRSAEDDLEARPTKRRVVESCEGRGRDVVDVSASMPGAHEPRPTPALTQLPTERPIAGTSRVEKRTKTVGFAPTLARTESGHVWEPKHHSTTATPVAVDASIVERAAACLDDELIFYMIDQILNH